MIEPYVSKDCYQLYHGNCLDVLKEMPDNSIDAICTDPPYGINFMGKKWDYDVPGVEIWKECLRVLKPGGHLLSFAGTRTQHRMAVNIEDAGFEIRDMIAWVYGSGFPKSADVSKHIDAAERKRWLDVSKALDNLKIATIIESWKKYLNTASTAGLLFAKNPTVTGTNTVKNVSAPALVLLQVSQENRDALALVAELSSKEALLLSETETSSALTHVDEDGSQSLEKSAEHLQKRFNATSTDAGIAHVAVLGWPSESTANNPKAVEALKIWLGSKPSSRKEATNALCAALTDDLRLITLNQSKTFQNFDTTKQTECASAISVTITESMAERLISFTVDTLRKQAIDRAAGAEREVVGVHKRHGGGSAESGSMAGPLGTLSELPLTAPATPEAQQWAGWGTALKPALEPITVARKPFTGTVAANVLAHGTGGINVDGCRVGHDEDCRMMAPSQANINNPSEKHRQAGRREAVLELKPSGRWPANLITDGSDEVVGLFPQTTAAKAGNRGAGKGATSCFGVYGGDPGFRGHDDNGGSAARFFYCAKASKKDRNEGLVDGANDHPTVKPTDLMRYLCRLVTPPGGTVLDPFLGSGTTGKAALLEGFNFIGIEMEEPYLSIAQQRIQHAYTEPDGK